MLRSRTWARLLYRLGRSRCPMDTRASSRCRRWSWSLAGLPRSGAPYLRATSVERCCWNSRGRRQPAAPRKRRRQAPIGTIRCATPANMGDQQRRRQQQRLPDRARLPRPTTASPSSRQGLAAHAAEACSASTTTLATASLSLKTRPGAAERSAHLRAASGTSQATGQLVYKRLAGVRPWKCAGGRQRQRSEVPARPTSSSRRPTKRTSSRYGIDRGQACVDVVECACRPRQRRGEESTGQKPTKEWPGRAAA